jgi:hypothetical protein
MKSFALKKSDADVVLRERGRRRTEKTRYASVRSNALGEGEREGVEVIEDDGDAPFVRLGVTVGDLETVMDGVCVLEGVIVLVVEGDEDGVAPTVSDGVRVGVGVCDGVGDFVGGGVFVAVGEGVRLGLAPIDRDGVGVGVIVGVTVAVGVPVPVGVLVGVGVGLGVTDGVELNDSDGVGV